ncbi:hypothetical protein DBP12_36630 [Streptomyces sp. CS014]|nr:hypothetical protein DBP12_36630 [Streptomyces sp. CS014]
MVPGHRHLRPRRGAAPRTCGDGPSRLPGDWVGRYCSPHVRRWSQDPAAVLVPAGLLPAPAGMVP